MRIWGGCLVGILFSQCGFCHAQMVGWFGGEAQALNGLGESDVVADIEFTTNGSKVDASSEGSKLMRPGMVVTLKGPRKGLYCSSGGGHTVCDSEFAGKWERFQVIDGGQGRIALRIGHRGENQTQVMPQVILTAIDVGPDKVALKRKGKFCSDTEPLACSAKDMGKSEKFSVGCLSGCDTELDVEPVATALPVFTHDMACMVQPSESGRTVQCGSFTNSSCDEQSTPNVPKVQPPLGYIEGGKYVVGVYGKEVTLP